MRLALLFALLHRIAFADPRPQTLWYRVREGDTLELLAAEYYGDRKGVAYILLANRMQHERPVKPGERLRIARPGTIVADVGDSFAKIAESSLGDARHGAFLAKLNRLDPTRPPPAGAELFIPAILDYTSAGESLKDVARAFGLEPEVLRDFNGLHVLKLEKGEMVRVPLASIRLSANRQAPLDASSDERKRRRTVTQKQISMELPRLRAAWRDNNFFVLRERLLPIDPAYLDEPIATEVAMFLGATHVAFGDSDLATVVFRQLHERNPDYVPSRYQFSPKILDVWGKATKP